MKKEGKQSIIVFAVFVSIFLILLIPLVSAGLFSDFTDFFKKIFGVSEKKVKGEVGELYTIRKSISGEEIPITDCQKLQSMKNDLTANYILTKDIDCSDTINWNSGKGFEPIGSLSNKFTGSFNGQGYKITGLYINRPSENYVGLFGVVDLGSEIKKIGFKNFYVTGKDYVGSLIGNLISGIVNEVYGEYVSAYGYGNEIGGLVGGTGYGYGIITNTYTTGSVIGKERVGGLVGWGDGNIENSYSTAEVKGNSYVGGLVGYNNKGTIKNSFSTGISKGFVDYNSGNIINSYGYNYNKCVNTNLGNADCTVKFEKSYFYSKNNQPMTSWDFVNIWKEITNNYPILQISCKSKTCSELGKECGSWNDGCGNIIDCGSCASGTCVNGKCLQRCVDSDGGNNIYVKGIITGYNNSGGLVTYEDSCIILLNRSRVIEYYCSTDGSERVISYPVRCEKGCVDGACIGEIIEPVKVDKCSDLSNEIKTEIALIKNNLSNNYVAEEGQLIYDNNYLVLGYGNDFHLVKANIDVDNGAGNRGITKFSDVLDGSVYGIREYSLNLDENGEKDSFIINGINYTVTVIDASKNIVKVTWLPENEIYTFDCLIIGDECEDSDGIDIFVKGNCTDILGVHEESCTNDYNDQRILEYYCHPTQKICRVFNQDVICPGGCVDGACIKEANPSLGIATELSHYFTGEIINLTDPPISNQDLSIKSGKSPSSSNDDEIIKSTGSSLTEQKPKIHGYIVEFKEKPLVAKQIEIKKEAEKTKEKSSSYLKDSQEGFFLFNWYEEYKANSLKNKYEKIKQKEPKELIEHAEKIKKEHKNAIEDIKGKAGITGMAISKPGSEDSSVIKEFSYAFNGIVLNITEQEANEIKKSEYVKAVYPNYEVKALLESSIPAMDIDTARDYSGLTGEGITISVIDSGIDPEHESLDDLDDNPETNDPKIIGWKDYVNFEPEPYDDNGHGTHVSGIATGTGGSNGLYKGVAPKANLVGVKVLDEWGSGTFDSVIAGIEWTIQNKEIYNILVISMSLGADINSDGTTPIEEAADYAVLSGINFAVAAGNAGSRGKNTVGIPASAFNVITVGAVDDSMNIAKRSSRGPTKDGRLKPEISAVGVNVMAPDANSGDRYVEYSGTSMATPHVAGFIALLLEQNPSLTTEEVKNLLIRTAVDKGEPGPDNSYGYGVLNGLETLFLFIPPEHEVSLLSVNAPRFVDSGEGIIVVGEIKNIGLFDESASVKLKINNILQDTKNIEILSKETKQVSFNYIPNSIGAYNITIEIIPTADTVEGNNEKTVELKVIEIQGEIKAVVVDSWGTDKSEFAIFNDLNENWMDYGNYLVDIDYTSLDKEGITYEDIANTNADVLIISDAWANGHFGMYHMFSDGEISAIKQYVKEGHGIIGTSGTLSEYVENNIKLAELFGIKDIIGLWSSRDSRLFSGKMNLLVKDGVLTKNIPLIYETGNVGSVINLELDKAVLVAKDVDERDLWKNIFISAYKPDLGASVYFTNMVELNNANQNDKQFFYNAILWTHFNVGELNKDIELKNLQAPNKILLGNKSTISADIKNNGLNAEDATVQLNINDVIEESLIISLNPNEQKQVNLNLTLKEFGKNNVSIKAVPLAGENYIINNELVKQILAPPIIFNDHYNDYGVDEDGDSLYESLAIEIGVDVFKKGTYVINFDVTSFLGAKLESVEGYAVEVSETNNSITVYVPVININKMGLNGPYKIKNLEIISIDYVDTVIDSRKEVFTTKAYKYYDFISPSKFLRQFNDYGVDEDGDSLYDYLVIEAGMDIKTPGIYYIQGELFSLSEEQITGIWQRYELERGIQNITLNFNGIDIRKKGYDGPYVLKNLVLRKETEKESEEHDKINGEAYTTKDYKVDEFQTLKDVGLSIRTNYLIVDEENNIVIEVYNYGTEKAEDVEVLLYEVLDRYWENNEPIETLRLIGNKTIGRVNINSWEEIIFTYTPNEIGTVRLKAVAGLEGDENLENNKHYNEIKIRTRGADLIARLQYNQLEYIVNQEQDVLFSIYNDGTETAKNVIVNLYEVEEIWTNGEYSENLKLMGTKNLQDIDVYNNKEDSFKWTPQKYGNNKLKIEVSCDNEGYAGDNYAYNGINVRVNNADLSGWNKWTRENKIAGKETIITIYASNQGAIKARNVTANLYKEINFYDENELIEYLEFIETKNLIDIEPNEQTEVSFNYIPYIPKKVGYENLIIVLNAENEGNPGDNKVHAGFYAVPKSMINNTEDSELKGRLLVKIIKRNYTEGVYIDIDKAVIIDEEIVIPPKGYIAIDEMWINKGGYIVEEGGDYRVYAALLDERGQVIRGLEGIYEFSLFI